MSTSGRVVTEPPDGAPQRLRVHADAGVAHAEAHIPTGRQVGAAVALLLVQLDRQDAAPGHRVGPSL
jgi:hypothetical protein